MPGIDRKKLLESMISVSLAAGEEILKIYRTPSIAVNLKSDQSPVTAADLIADQIISMEMGENFPMIPLVTEEQAQTHRATDRRFILVDPLDGTKEFVNKSDDFTVNVALVENGVPTLGVVYAPAHGRIFYTGADAGSWQARVGDGMIQHDSVKRISANAGQVAAIKAVASKSHRDAATDQFLSLYNVGSLVSAGSSLKFCLVATGEADLYPRFGPTMEWDTAAGDAIARAAGAHSVDPVTGRTLVYGKPDFRNGPFVCHAASIVLAPAVVAQ